MGFCLGFVSLLINGPRGRQLRLPGPRNFLTWLDYYVLCKCGYMFKELLNKSLSLSLWFVRETTSTYKYRLLYDMGQWLFPLTIWSGFSLIAKRTCILHRIRHMVDFLTILFWMRGIGFLRKTFTLVWPRDLACMRACFLEPFACESAFPQK